MNLHLLLPKLIVFILSTFQTNAQSSDTCVYVHNYNDIGGFDCAMVSLAPYTADSYQWLSCGDSLNAIPGQTTSYYSGPTSTYVALVVNYLGCVDTSYCEYACTWGIEELLNDQIELVEVYDIMGRKTEDRPNTLLIYLYSDGTTEKVFRIAE